MVLITDLYFTFQAKYYQRISAERERVLPYVQSDGDLQKLIPHDNSALQHSKTESNLNKNGFNANNHNNVFLQNLSNFEQVTLIPVIQNERTQSELEGDLHSRDLHSRATSHVYDV